MRYRALIFDLDGTAIPNSLDGVPSQRVINAVKRAQKSVRVSAATGRPYSICHQIFEQLGLVDPCVINGGAEILDVKNGTIVYKKLIPPTVVNEIIGRWKELNLEFRVYLDDDRYDIRDLDKTDREVGKITVISSTSEDMDKLTNSILNINEIAAHPVTSWKKDRIDIHITHAQATKEHTIKQLLKILQVDKEETIGVGDSDNDLPLFNSVGLKVAMGNATSKLKQRADEVVASVENDGLAEAIEKFIISGH